MSLSVLTRTPRKLVRLRNVSVSRIESDSDVRVQESINDVTLDVYACRTYAFLTEGTSPILRVLARLAQPENGKITWGQPLFGWGKPTPVAYLAKGVRLSHDVPVRDELLTALAQAGANIDDDDFHRIISDLRLADLLDQRTASLPQEVAYRVMIARALMLGARLIILDEPTVSMSPAAAESLLNTVLSMGNAGYTVVIQTRSPEVAAQFGHVFLLINGLLVGSFDAPELSALRVEYSAAMGAAEALNHAQQLSALRSSTDEASRAPQSLTGSHASHSGGAGRIGGAGFVGGTEREDTGEDEGVVAPRWVPTRSTEYAPLTPIPDAQRQPATPNDTDNTGDTPANAEAGQPANTPAQGETPTEAPTQVDVVTQGGADASASGDTANVAPPHQRDETLAMTPDQSPHTSAEEVSEEVPARSTLSSAHRPTFPSRLVERPQERPVILEEEPIPLTGHIPSITVEPAPVTTALPLIPRTSRETIDADAEKVIEQAQNILKDLPGSIVPHDNDTATQERGH